MRVFEPRAGLEQVGAAAVDLGILLVPENVAPVGVEKDDALGQDVDRLAQPFVGFSRLCDRRLGLRARVRSISAISVATLGRLPPANFGLTFTGRPGKRAIAACLRFLEVLGRNFGMATPYSRSAWPVLR